MGQCAPEGADLETGRPAGAKHVGAWQGRPCARYRRALAASGPPTQPPPRDSRAPCSSRRPCAPWPTDAATRPADRACAVYTGSRPRAARPERGSRQVVCEGAAPGSRRCRACDCAELLPAARAAAMAPRPTAAPPRPLRRSGRKPAVGRTRERRGLLAAGEGSASRLSLGALVSDWSRSSRHRRLCPIRRVRPSGTRCGASPLPAARGRAAAPPVSSWKA